MLIKARPVAGDERLGMEFLHLLEPFVYPRTFFSHPTEAVARIKARIEAEAASGENIKLRAGGIRDIEFVIQTLQLLNGGKNRNIREANSMQALRRLESEQLLSAGETATLAGAYAFFRTVEHRLQMLLNTQTHSIPQDGRTRTSLARRLGLSSAEDLDEVNKNHLKAVRRIFDAVLSVRAEPVDTSIASIVDGCVGKEGIDRILGGIGFRDVRKASRNLSLLVSGSSLTGTRVLDTRVRDAFRGVAGVLFADIAQTPSPDLTLNNLTVLSEAQKLPEQLYSQLADGKFRKFVLRICSISPRLAKGLAGDPLLLECLSGNIASLAAGPQMILPPSPDLVLFKHQQELRAGIRHLLGFTSFEEFTRELTLVADWILATVFTGGTQRYRFKDFPLAIFALGKYGTREINLDADLDLFFVSRKHARISQSSIERTAGAIMKRLSEVSDHGKLYDVDARLRPEGKNSPLVVDRTGYRKYLAERASLWERQSLTRVRFICGNPGVGQEVLNDVNAFVYETPLPQDWTGTIVAMRRKMETRSRTHARDFIDIKLGAGGMADIEFLAQMLQLKFGRIMTELRGKETRTVLLNSVPFGLEKADAETLSDAYGFLRQLEKLMRFVLEEKGSILPGGGELDTIARCSDQSSGDRLKARVISTMKDVRARFLRVARRMALPEGA
jgi:glutamate-ammonia-ligase adenylyltransferase